MGHHHEALIETLNKMACAGVELHELAFARKDYLALAYECGLSDPKSPIRPTLIRRKTYRNIGDIGGELVDEVVDVRMPDSFIFQGPTGAVKIRNVDAVPYVIASASDGQLRTEIERRGMLRVSDVPYGSPLSLSRENDKLRAELDYWKKSAEGLGESVPVGFTAQAGRCMRTGAFTVEQFKARVDELLALETKKCPCGCNALREGSGHISGAAMALLQEPLRNELDEWKARAERAEAANVAAIREAKVRLLPANLREVQPNTIGEVWQQYALGEVSEERMEKASGMDHASFIERFGCAPLTMSAPVKSPPRETIGTAKDLALVFNDGALPSAERGPGIARLPEPRPEPLAFLDVDLLCDDE